MSTTVDRGHRLRLFDTRAQAFTQGCAERFEAGAGAARRDVEILNRLASAIAGALAAWVPILGRLDVAAAGDLDFARAGRLLLESVFDEVLDPAAWRVLAAALDLAGDTP